MEKAVILAAIVLVGLCWSLTQASTAVNGVSQQYTCMEAREYYKSNNLDVDFETIDPVYHYQTSDKSMGRLWRVDLCGESSIYAEDPACNCSTAIEQFKLSYPNVEEDPFTYWVQHFRTEGVAWHCEICPVYFQTHKAALDEPTNKHRRDANIPPYCLNARLDFWMRYLIANDTDPLYYMQVNPNARINNQICISDTTPTYLSDPVCQCDAVKARYVADFPIAGLTQFYPTPFDHYMIYGNTTGSAWHCEMCPGAVSKLAQVPADLTPDCLCMAARTAYSTQYPSRYDPVYQYQTYGINSSTQASAWDCEVCNSNPIFIDNPGCSCPEAQNAYIAAHPDAGRYFTPFLHYWNSYLTLGYPWKCELCPAINQTATPPPVPTAAPTPMPFINTPECTCLAARFDYLSRYPDVEILNIDPVVHYSLNNKSRLWRCDLCLNASQQLDRETCDCSAAAARYRVDINDTTNPDPFATYLESRTYNWHCELCDIANVTELDESCNCLSANYYYLLTYPFIQVKPYMMDPAFHYRWYGHKSGMGWRCDLCHNTSHYISDQVCNCPQAVTGFRNDYPTLSIVNAAQYNNPHQYWVDKHRYYGNVWKCGNCVTTVADPSTSLTCNCTDARAKYLDDYLDVTGDPWTFYKSVGKARGDLWDCGICNDTCPGVIPATSRAGVVWAYAGQPLSSFSIVTVLPGCYIPINSTVSVSASSLVIFLGVLRCISSTSTKLSITTKKIYISGGAFECGTAANPLLQGSVLITLVGVRGTIAYEASSITTGGNKNVAVANGGKLLLHGAKQVAWTRLAVTAQPGDTNIQVTAPVDWQVGDQIVIATTDQAQIVAANMNQTAQGNEVRTITGIDGSHKIIYFNTPLACVHLAQAEDVSFLSNSLSLQRYAEVGLLGGRNIIIQGDQSTAVSKYGAQVVVLPGGFAYVSGIQINLAGQKGLMGRYPFQWYNNAAGGSQYFKNSTITNSNNRCVVISNTNRVLVQNNLCYNFMGSGFALETGSETQNTINGNLALHSIRPDGTDPISPAEVFNGPRAFGPASFLITNPNNTVINNVAADGVGTGFWYKIEANFSLNATVRPQNAPWGVISGNTAHSIVQGFSTCPIGTASGSASLRAPVDGLTIYSVNSGIFGCGAAINYRNLIIAEANVGAELATRQFFTGAAWVNYIATPPFVSSTAFNYNYGDFMLDQVLFRNYDQASNSSVLRPKTGWGFTVATRVSNLVMDNSPVLYYDPNSVVKPDSSYGAEWSSVINDLDGSLTGTAGTAFVPPFPLMFDSGCTQVYNGYSCPYHYAEARLYFSGFGVPNTKVARYAWDGSNVKHTITSAASEYAQLFPIPTQTILRWGVITNNYIYQVAMPVTNLRATFAFVAATARQGDAVLLQLHNVKSMTATTSVGLSCTQVFQNGIFSSYFFDSDNGVGCIRLNAVNRSVASDSWSYSANIPITISTGPDKSIQPPAPYSNMPYSVPARCQCISAMRDYWERYPQVADSETDPVFHYQYYGGALSYTWDCSQCDDSPRYVTEPYCNCSAAAQMYRQNRTLTASWDPYTHYLLYQLYLGYAYHCEYCPIPPPNATTYFRVVREYNAGLAAGLGAFTAIGVLIAMFCGIMLSLYWKSFTKHGSFYCSLIILGSLLSYVSVLTLLPQPSDALCLAFPWFLGVSFSLVYGCLFIKTWALYQVWRNAAQMQRSTLTPAYIIKGILFYMTIEVAYLIIWSVYDRPTVHLEKLIDDSYQPTCTSESYVFWIVFVVVKAVWLFFGAVLSFLTRNIVKEYSESKGIAYAIYNIVLLGVIGGPVIAYVQAAGVGGAVLVIEVVLIVLAFTFTLAVLFFGIIYSIFFPPDPVAAKLSNLQTKSNHSSLSPTGEQKNSKGSKGSGNSNSGNVSDEVKFTSSMDKSGISGGTSNSAGPQQVFRI